MSNLEPVRGNDYARETADVIVRAQRHGTLNPETAPLVLTLNAGSSSLRLALFVCSDGGAVTDAVLRLRVERPGSRGTPVCHAEGALVVDPALAEKCTDHRGAIHAVLGLLANEQLLPRIVAVGHRVVHGGPHTGPARVSDSLIAELDALIPLAPLHQPEALALMRAVASALPEIQQFACFDTAFHTSMPNAARHYGLAPLGIAPQILRYGFHGLSYAYVTRTLAALVPAARRIVIAHLGSGASLCAVLDGNSIDTTMGMTPLDGLPMSSRSGSIDPGILLWLLNHHGYTGSRLEQILYRESGLLGMSGISGDMRTLLQSREPGALEAVEVFVHQCARSIGALCASLGGLDALAFTGGIGEHAPEIRARIVARLEWLGVRLDAQANDSNRQRVSVPGSAVSLWVIPTDEERTMADQIAPLLALPHS